jgi:hypothetical protein
MADKMAGLRTMLDGLAHEVATACTDELREAVEVLISIRSEGGSGSTTLSCASWESARALATNTLLAIEAGRQSGTPFKDRRHVQLSPADMIAAARRIGD